MVTNCCVQLQKILVQQKTGKETRLINYSTHQLNSIILLVLETCSIILGIYSFNLWNKISRMTSFTYISMSGMQTNEIKPVPLNDYVSLHWSSPTLVHYSSETLSQLSEPIKTLQLPQVIDV